MKKGRFLIACLGVCALVLAACGRDKTKDVPVSAEELRLQREKLLEQKSEAESPAPEAPVEEPVQEDEELVCYYTEKGGKWHTRENCQYLKNSKEIFSGSYESAVAAGKVTPCSACAAAYIEE